jgi:hypothetical protein
MKALEPVGERLMEKWGRPDPTDEDRQSMYRLGLAALSEGYINHVYMDPRHPTWVPAWNLAFNMAGPCPDYVYMTTDVDPKGIYKISGFRGSVRFVEITQQGYELLGGPGTNTPAGGTNDLDSLQIAPNGYFSVIMSAERPADYTGDWWPLSASATRLLMRSASYDWINEADPRVAIDRLDDGPPTPTAEFVRRFSNMPDWVEKLIGFDIDLARYYCKNHGVNQFGRSTILANMGGMPNQVGLSGGYEIADDEALIIDTALPATCRYWSFLVADDRFSTVDWANRQSSLNGFQAHVDSDGRFRAVISAKDPGVHNWLDKADNPSGIMQCRWNRPSDAPHPGVKKVPFPELRDHLPKDTRFVSAAERREQLRLRREGAQLRRLW